MTRPTDNAKEYFQSAAEHAGVSTQIYMSAAQITAAQEKQGSMHENKALALVSEGLGEMAVGLRATYMLLEEIKKIEMINDGKDFQRFNVLLKQVVSVPREEMLRREEAEKKVKAKG